MKLRRILVSLTVFTEVEIEPEQINDGVQYIFDCIKSILEKDETGVFNLKAHIKLDSETERIDAEIQRRIQHNVQKKSQNEKLTGQLNKLEDTNFAKIQKLSEGLG